jgi:hypothetical protein
MMRSASVDLPWSTWAMIEKLRMWSIGSAAETGHRHKRRIIAEKRAPNALFRRQAPPEQLRKGGRSLRRPR